MVTLTNKTIWITGATSPLGTALANALAENGNHVIASGTNETALAALAERSDGRITKLPVDLCDRESLERACERLGILTDTLDLAIVAPEESRSRPTAASDSRQVQRATDTLYLGAVNAIDVALPRLANADNPQLVVFSYLPPRLARNRDAAWGAARAALEYYVRSLAGSGNRNRLAVTLVRTWPESARPDAVGAGPATQCAVILRAIARRKRLVDCARLPVWRRIPGWQEAVPGTAAPSGAGRARRVTR